MSATAPSASLPTVQSVKLDQVRADQRAQPRESLNTEVTQRYAEEMVAGAKFPPLVVFFDGETYWLADGFHRRYAAISVGLSTLPCEVHAGDCRAAILFSCSVNAAHGIQRTNEDKRRAVLKLLRDEEWSHWSDREIARQCRVSHTFVSEHRPALTGNVASEPTERTYTTKHGTTSTMRVVAGHSRSRPSSSPVLQTVRNEPPPARPMRGKAAICARVRDAIAALSGLPPPSEVVGFLKDTDDALLIDERLPTVQRWLDEFASLWGEHHAD